MIVAAVESDTRLPDDKSSHDDNYRPDDLLQVKYPEPPLKEFDKHESHDFELEQK